MKIDTSGPNSLAPFSEVDDDLGENLFSSVPSFQLPRTTDFDGFQKKAVEMVKPAKGTTTLAFKHGVIVATDSRASMGGYICLKECMKRGYWYVDGIEDLLQDLKRSNYEMHAFTNYPIWYLMIEEKLRISTYLSWTFCSCAIGKLKPASDLYLEVCERLGVDPA